MSRSDIGTSFVYLFATPWWRLLWFVCAVLWCVAFNVLYITGGNPGSWFGPISVIPIGWFAVDVFIRSRKLALGRPR